MLEFEGVQLRQPLLKIFSFQAGIDLFGYFVEWEGTFKSFTPERFEIILRLEIGSPPSFYTGLWLLLPLTYFDLLKVLKTGQRLRARGVIDDILVGIVTLNYVDLEIVGESDGH